MKKQISLLVCGLFLLTVFPSCFRGHHYSSISISDSRDEYEMTASYEKTKARKLKRFLETCFGEDRCYPLRRATVDAEITLEDRTRFYMSSYPGQLEIRFDKTENSDESYFRMKDICEDIKDILARN